MNQLLPDLVPDQRALSRKTLPHQSILLLDLTHFYCHAVIIILILILGNLHCRISIKALKVNYCVFCPSSSSSSSSLFTSSTSGHNNFLSIDHCRLVSKIFFLHFPLSMPSSLHNDNDPTIQELTKRMHCLQSLLKLKRKTLKHWNSDIASLI